MLIFSNVRGKSGMLEMVSKEEEEEKDHRIYIRKEKYTMTHAPASWLARGESA